jgi:hypothetical protein
MAQKSVNYVLIKLYTKILWHSDPLFGNDREISNYITAVAK